MTFCYVYFGLTEGTIPIINISQNVQVSSERLASHKAVGCSKAERWMGQRAKTASSG